MEVCCADTTALTAEKCSQPGNLLGCREAYSGLGSCTRLHTLTADNFGPCRKMISERTPNSKLRGSATLIGSNKSIPLVTGTCWRVYPETRTNGIHTRKQQESASAVTAEALTEPYKAELQESIPHIVI